MAKRFTDTAKYDRAWFRKLAPRLKCAWDWLTLNCDPIGIWNIDMEKLSFEVGEPVDLQELVDLFKVQFFEDDKLFIPGFVQFQYADESGLLSPKNKFHVSIVRKLTARGLPVPSLKTSDVPIDTHPIFVWVLGSKLFPLFRSFGRSVRAFCNQFPFVF